LRFFSEQRRQILSKPYGKTEAVIIARISKKHRDTETGTPWGLESVDNLAQKVRNGSLPEHIVQYQMIKCSRL